MPTRKLTLLEWISKQGTRKISKLLSINESTVRHWRRGFSLPSARLMFEIKKLTRGVVDYNGIIEPHFKKKAAK